MWTTKSFSPMLEGSQQNNTGYAPPEKKQKCLPETNYLKEALECCKNQEIGIEEASLIYGIPKRTLRAKLRGSDSSVIDEKYTVIVLSVYPAEAEADLAGYLQDCITSLITLSTTDVRRFAYELVCDKYKLNNFPMEKNCILGQRWYKKFTEKYPHLDMRNQMLKVNEEKTTNFYNSLESLVNEFNISNSQIYSMDGVDLKFRASFFDDVKGFSKRRTIYTNAKAICCTNPNGDFVPPVFLEVQNNFLKLKRGEFTDFNLDFHDDNSQNKDCNLSKAYNLRSKTIPSPEDLLKVEKQIKEHLNKKFQPMSEDQEEELRENLYEQFVQLENKIISQSEIPPTDITPDIFLNWLSGFINYVKPTPQRKVLLLLPEEKYVKSFKILELGKKNGVIFLILPPHSIHKIHPLDGFSMSLNRNLSTCTRRWLGNNSDSKTFQVPLEMLFMEAFTETINPIIAKNGFLYSGICPINKNIFQSSELGGECILLLNKSKLINNELSVTDVNRNNCLLAGIRNEADVKKLCRVCLKEKMYMKPLFESFPSPVPNYHGRKISEITKMPISYGDGLPTSLCQYCLVQLMDTMKTKDMAVESHKKQLRLRETLDRMYFEEEESENQELLCLLQCATAQLNDSKTINRVISKNFDINSICRICMGEKSLMTSIFFRPQSGVMLRSDTCNRIMEVSHCQVHYHDGLSSSICPFCLASINKASEFIQKMLNSDKILREIVSQFRTKN